MSETAPELIGGYELVRLLGEGGFGRAHLAKKGPRKVVLKESFQTFGDGEKPVNVSAREILKREADFMKQFDNHDHLPTLIDFIPGVQSQWLVLEFIDGSIISEAIEELRPYFGQEHHLRTIAQWALELAATLRFLHSFSPEKIVHCDINPGNLMVRKNGKLTLIDFGISRSVRGDGVTQGEQDFSKRLGLFGWKGFVAPELLNKGSVSPAVDVFSAGVMLYWWLTGVQPNPDGESIQHLPSPERKGDELWDGLAAIADQSREPDPTRRINAAQMEQSLRELLTDPKDRSDETFPCPVCRHELRAANNFCPACGVTLNTEQAPTAGAVAIQRGETHSVVEQEILKSSRTATYADLRRFEVFQQIRRSQKDPGFSELISLPYLPRVEKLPHQIAAAKRALDEMRGLCLLADEVGLGKTIEAGIILKELTLRGLAKRILIVASTPQMANQWQQELFEKFEIYFPVFGKDVDHTIAWDCDRVITSYQITKNRIQRTAIENAGYDLVIMDEAHHLISSDTYNRQQSEILKSFAENVRRSADYFLMLSATPFHNYLEELHTLLWLLKPGAVDDYNEFKKRHVNPENPNQPRNVKELRAKLNSILIRNRRSQVRNLTFPRRVASDMAIEVSAEHRKLFDDFHRFVRERIWKVAVTRGADELDVNRDFRIGLQRIVESFHSSADAYENARQHFEKTFSGMLKQERYAELPGKLREFGRRISADVFQNKIDRTHQILSSFQQAGKFLIFTQYADTARVLYESLAGREGIEIELYPTEEEFDAVETNAILDRFESSSRAMICAENAAEGLNLQKIANSVINFDLPWDPMKLEQRIGRVQRIGQTSSEIYIYNLFFSKTVENDIYKVLKGKLHLFETTVGRVEDIVGTMIGDDQFQLQMLDLYVNRGDAEKEIEIENKLDEFAYENRGDRDTLGNALNLVIAEDDEEEDEGDETPIFLPRVSLFRRCGSCNEELEPEANVCGWCGEDYAAPTLAAEEPDDEDDFEQPSALEEQAAVVCKQCNSVLPPGSDFCMSCQTQVIQENEDDDVYEDDIDHYEEGDSP